MVISLKEREGQKKMKKRGRKRNQLKYRMRRLYTALLIGLILKDTLLAIPSGAVPVNALNHNSNVKEEIRPTVVESVFQNSKEEEVANTTSETTIVKTIVLETEPITEIVITEVSTTEAIITTELEAETTVEMNIPIIFKDKVVEEIVPIVVNMNASAYCPCEYCCGKGATGHTACGELADRKSTRLNSSH